MSRSAPTGAGLADRFFEFSLLGLVASGYLALAGSGYLGIPVVLLTGAGLVVRALTIAGFLRVEPSHRFITAVTLLYLAFYPVDYFLISKDFLRATVHVVCFLAVAKILAAKTNRDYVCVKIIAFLELLAAAVLSTSLTFFVFLALFLLFGVATFTSAEICRGTRGTAVVASGGLRRFHCRLAALSIFIAAGVLSLTGAFFFVLPRTANAAFRHIAPERYHLPGFSNEVRLGAIGEVLQQNTPVMHVRLVSEDRPLHLKWRGAVLSQFDGKRWFNFQNGGSMIPVRGGQAILGTDDERRRDSRILTYEVQLRSLGTDSLFFTGIPIAVSINAPRILRTSTGAYRLGYGGSDGLRYIGYSLPASDAAPGAAPSAEMDYLQLPPLDSRIEALARRVTAGIDSDLGRVQAIEKHLRTAYGYTLDLPEEERADPLAQFLFERRRGHCEYFASTMAVMLRTLGVPSRVVTGFHGGVFNPISGWHVIRTSDAHSWVEVWLPGRGWRIFDPTPPDPSPKAAFVWMKLFLYMDAAETFWRDWVVNYDRERQVFLATRMGNSSRGWGTAWFDRVRDFAAGWKSRIVGWVTAYGPLGLGIAAAVLLAYRYGSRILRICRTRAGVLRASRGEAQVSDAALLYSRMLRLLERRGLRKPPWLTPAEFAAVMPASETASIVRDFTAAYNELRYGGKLAAAPRISALLERLQSAG